MADWRYLATRLNGDGTEDLIAPELPLADVQITKVLSGPDQITATVPVEVDRLRGSDRSIFLPWSTAIYAEKDGVIRAGGIVVDVDLDGPKISLTVDGFTGYLHGVPYPGEASYIRTPAMDVATGLWATVQGAAGADLGLQVHTAGTCLTVGVPDLPEGTNTTIDGDQAGPYRLSWWEDFDLGGKFDDLANVGGFDYREDHAWSGEILEHHLWLEGPRIGARREELRCVVGENVMTSPVVEATGDEYADEVIMFGAGEGRAMVRGSWRTATGRLRRPKIVTDKLLRSTATANAAAAVAVTRLVGDEDVKTVVLRDHPNAPFGSWGLGDELLIQGNGTGWAGDLNLWVRVLSYTISPAAGDTATLTVTRSDRSTA